MALSPDVDAPVTLPITFHIPLFPLRLCVRFCFSHKRVPADPPLGHGLLTADDRSLMLPRRRLDPEAMTSRVGVAGRSHSMMTL